MSVYKTPIISGIVISLVLIYLITVPVAIYQYRKYNGIMIRRNIVLFSFIIYMVTAWFMTLLPLPTFEEVANMPDIIPNLKPFLFVETFLERTKFTLFDVKTWLPSLKSSSFYTVAFNVLLTLPFGVYLRKYFKFSMKKTILFGILLSCFYEITQYTGIYGIYPKAFRYADIDDVIVNTFGTFLGYVITPILEKILPNVDKDKKVVATNVRAGIIRRALSYFVDSLIIGFLSFAVLLFTSLLLRYILGVKENLIIFESIIVFATYLIYYILIPLIHNGNTLGMNILKLKLTDNNLNIPKKKKIVFRYILILLTYKIDTIFYELMNTGNNIGKYTSIAVSSISNILTIILLITAIMTLIKKKDLIYYDRITGTKVMISE